MKLDRDKFLTVDEFHRLLRAVRTRVRVSAGSGQSEYRRRGAPHKNMLRDYALLATSGLTGFREIEILGLRVGDLIDFGTLAGSPPADRPPKLRVRRAKKRKVVYDEIAVPEAVRKAILQYLASRSAESKTPVDRIFQISTKQAQRLFKWYCKRAGLSENFTMHALRHKRGVELMEKYRDLKLVQQALGHTNIETTAIYLHTVDLDQKLSAAGSAEDETLEAEKP